MEEKNQTIKEEKKNEEKKIVTQTKNEEKKVENKKETKKIEEKKNEEKKTETNKEEKKNEKKKEVIQKEKTKAIARGVSLRISPKYAMAICKMIKGKTPEQATNMLEEVTKKKRPVPMKAREVPHQKGKGIAGAKYPITAAKEIKRITEQAKANAEVNGIENPIIVIAKADRATAPLRVGGKKAKRAHVLLEVRDKTKMKGTEIKTKEKKK
jgi:ribosomal protein L22